MSGLYNMLMGRNPVGPHLLAILNITQQTLGRFRDVGVSEDGKTIFILTRNYGAEWEHVDKALAAHPNFIKKVAESDETYSSYHFATPEDAMPLIERALELCEAGNPFDRYLKAIKEFSEGKDNPQTRHMEEVGKKIVEPLVKAIQDGENTSETIESGDGAVHIMGINPNTSAIWDEEDDPKKGEK